MRHHRSRLTRAAIGCAPVLGVILAAGPVAGAAAVTHAGPAPRVAVADGGGSNPECLGTNCGAPNQEGGQ